MAHTQINGTDRAPTVEELSEQIKQLKEELARIGNTVGSIAETGGSVARKEAAAQMEGLRETAEAAGAQAQKSVMEGAAELERAARQNPGMALGIVAGLGFLFGYMTARK
ncbi:MAG: hypothetical protein AAF618_04665 [Pseudomonadota bacterium]